MLYTLWLVLMLIQFRLILPSAIKGTEPTISECAAKGGECDETKGRPVCGTDNQTYPTRCHLIRAQCSGHQVSLKHRGTCKNECVASRNYALTHRSSSTFIPRCRADGSYAAIQCLETSNCWCVNSQGKPIPHTTVQNGKPTCMKNSKSNTRRSSPRTVKNKRGCSQMDKIQFNTNLIKMFQNEHARYKLQNSQIYNPSSNTDKVILDWKFSALDKNGNHVLDKNEFRDLKRLVKKVVKPKRCARAFGKLCDADMDDQLSRQEWTVCFSKDGNNHETSLGAFGRINGDNLMPDDSNEDYTDTDDESDEPDTGNTLIGLPLDAPMLNKPGFILHGKTTLELTGDGDTLLRESNDGESDCLADRIAALDEQKSGTAAMYVPECTADGRYQRVQCYRSTGYCWCVHEDTGKNIPGTSTKDQRPQCDSIYSASRPMKGCPEGTKIEFLKDLKDFLRAQIIANGNTGANTTVWATEDERIATLSFVILDKNKNKVWERKEWKTFRELVTAVKHLRKCGKKMPRYCDVNNDKEITLSEWLNCLQTQRIPATPTGKVTTRTHLDESRPPTQSKLKGPNPLESILKSD